MTVEGFRTSLADVAAFRFSSVRDSYAARTGSARNVGVIGVAFFPERPAPPPPPHAWTPRADVPADDALPQSEPEGVRPSPPAPTARRESASGSGDLGRSAPSAAAPPAGARAESKTSEARKRPGLGTEFGERRESAVSYASFVRANPSSPSRTMNLYYNDRDGLVALGIRIPRPSTPREDDARLRETAEPFARRFAAPPPR